MVPLDDTADLLFTADFFTPIVDDAYNFGAIAAANALSDVYAKGGTPIASLNLAAFPERFDAETLREILRGGCEKASEAGAPVVGGHTVKDKEIKFGMAVIGRVRKQDFLPIGGARVGEALVLGKAIGTGILTTALKRGMLDERSLAGVTETMLRLNRDAAAAALRHHVSAATDVTGFGLLGHLLNILRASHVSAEISTRAVPLLEGVVELASKGVVPGGAVSNLEYVSGVTTFVDDLALAMRHVLCDPQTSGGLLCSVSADRADDLASDLARAGYRAAVVGRVTGGDAGHLVVR